MGFHTKDECTRGQECDVPSHRPKPESDRVLVVDPTTEAMHDRNERLTTYSEMLGKIWLLCGGTDGETALHAAERIVFTRNTTITALRAELDIARRKLEEVRRTEAAEPADYKRAKEELERLRSQLAEMTKQRGNALDDWRAERERSREVVDVLADYAIERIHLKRQLEHESQQHEAQYEGDRALIRVQDIKIAELERALAAHVPARQEFERLEADNKRLRDQNAMLLGRLDAHPSKALIDAMALSELRDAAVQPVLDALASWSAPFAASMAHNVTEGEAANLAHLTLELHKAHKAFAEWVDEQERAIDDIPF